MLLLKLSFFLVVCCASVFARENSEFNFQLLKDRRATLKLPTYNTATKKLLIDQARLVMSKLFVHRDLKIKAFGEKIDPLPKLDKLEQSLDSMSDFDFHEQMIEIFNSQRDLHTQYELPRPYGCYRNMMPFSVNEIKKGTLSKIVVTNVIDTPEFLALLPKDLNIEIGDELLAYDGKPIQKLLKEMSSRNAGANDEATRRISLEDLSYKIQTVSLMPKNDEVKVIFKKQNGLINRVTIPWVNRGRLSCLKTYPETFGRSEFQDEFNKIYQNSSEDNQTQEPIVTWKMIESHFGKFAVLKLASFVPENVDDKGMVQVIEGLLKNEFAGTTGLIIDVRNNPGGLIPIGEMMLQLFGPHEKNRRLMFSFNVTTPNGFLLQHYFNSFNMVKSYNDAIDRNQKLSIPLPILTKKEMQFTTPAYSGPVAIFTNANCYSTCDMFSAQMQDHGYAVIVGEDKTTGGGGANYQTLKDIYEWLPADRKGVFKKLPKNQDMSFAWRQTYRITGQLIENEGVVSDVIVPTTLDDIKFQSRDQYFEISKILTTTQAKEIIPSIQK